MKRIIQLSALLLLSAALGFSQCGSGGRQVYSPQLRAFICTGIVTGGGNFYSAPASVAYTAGTYYFPPGGGQPANATEATVLGPKWTVAGSLSNFTVHTSAVAGSGVTLTFTWRKNAATDLSATCNFMGTMAQDCQDTTNSSAIAVNDQLTLKMVVAGGTYTGFVNFSWAAPGVVGPTGLTGATGSTGATGYSGVWVVTAGVPGGGTGNNGDMALNSLTSDVYGPKTAGAWGSIVVNIKGATGATGAAGATGATGAAGTNGMDGIGIVSPTGCLLNTSGLAIDPSCLNLLYAALAIANTWPAGVLQTFQQSAAVYGAALTPGVNGNCPSGMTSGGLAMNNAGKFQVGDGTNCNTYLSIQGSGATAGTAPTNGNILLSAGGFFASDSGKALTGLLIKPCEIVIGSPGSGASALANDDDTPEACGNDSGVTLTITAVHCYAPTGSPTVTPIITGSGGTSILSGALTCSNTHGGAAGTLNGTPTMANGDTIDANITTAGGTAKYLIIRITRTL